MLRLPACAAIVLLSLCACQETKINDPTLITGAGPVAVLQSSYVASGDSRAALAATTVTYVVCRIDLTNDLTVTLYPTISHFYLTSNDGNRYYGIDRGATALTGIANDVRPLKPGEKRTLVVGFRADATTIGTVRYAY